MDKSALARMSLEPVRARLAPILESGRAGTCGIIDLEILYSARGHEDHVATRERRRLAYERAPMTEEVFERAIEVQGELSRTRRHRIPIPDLLIAAAAECADLTVLHYDADFDRIAEVTGQPVEWVVPQRSL